MLNYRRNRVEGWLIFFIINLLEHHENLLLVHHIDLLRDVVQRYEEKSGLELNCIRDLLTLIPQLYLFVLPMFLCI